jgi:alpha-L-fucosidase
LHRRTVMKCLATAGLAVLGRDSLLAEASDLFRAENLSPSGTPESGQGLWYGQDLIRGHVSWLHPAWTRPEKQFDAKTWIDQLQKAGFHSFVFYSKFHDGVCNWPSKLQDIQPEQDFVGEITTEAHRRKMKVIIYYSAGPDEWAADRHPDWRCVRRDGSVAGHFAPGNKRWFKFARCCPNSPYRDYALSQIEEIINNYDVDGFWLDVMQFPDRDPDEPELGHLSCFCPWCRAKYSKLTDGGSLFDIDQTDAQKEWEATCYRDFFEAARGVVQKKGPDRSITYNGCGHVGEAHGSSEALPYYWPKTQALASYLSVEGFHFAQAQIGPQCRLCRSDGKPYEIICVASGQTISWTPKNTDLILLEAMTVVAHGGTYCCALDPTASGRIFDSQIDQLSAAASYIDKRKDLLTNTSPVYDVGIFHPSYLARQALHPEDTALTSMSNGWADMLDQRNLPYSFLYPNADLSPYRLVVLDSSFPLSNESVQKVEEYVRGGGNVLVELSPDQLQSAAAKTLLSTVLGVQVVGSNDYEAIYLGGLDRSISMGMTEMPTLVQGPSFRIQPAGARVLANYVYPIASWSYSRLTFAFHNPPSDQVSNHPAITVNDLGKGKAVFVACSLGALEMRRHQNILSDPETDLPQVHEFSLQLAQNLAASLIEEPIIRSDVPAGVALIVNRKNGRYIVHMLNNLLDPILFSDSRRGLVVWSGLTFAINQKRTGPIHRVILSDGRVLPSKTDGKWVTVTVPELTVHEAVVFETT